MTAAAAGEAGKNSSSRGTQWRSSRISRTHRVAAAVAAAIAEAKAVAVASVVGGGGVVVVVAAVIVVAIAKVTVVGGGGDLDSQEAKKRGKRTKEQSGLQPLTSTSPPQPTGWEVENPSAFFATNGNQPRSNLLLSFLWTITDNDSG